MPTTSSSSVLRRRKYSRQSESRSVFAQMTSCAMRYIIIYHPFRINSQYLKMLGVDSPAHSSSTFLKNYISNDYCRLLNHICEQH